MKVSSFLLLLSLLSFKATGQRAEPGWYFIPSVSLGFTFPGKGFCYGLELDIVKGRKGSAYPECSGLSLSKYWTRVSYGRKRDTHRHNVIAFCYLSRSVEAKAGLDFIRNPWGFGNHNRCRITGLSADISLSTPNRYTPWLGFKTVVYNRRRWNWFDKPYSTVYLQYKYEPKNVSRSR